MSMRRIYRKIAKKNGVTLAEVKQEIQGAINYTYEHCPNDGVTAAYQNRVPRKGEIPTADEFIRYAAQKAKSQTEK